MKENKHIKWKKFHQAVSLLLVTLLFAMYTLQVIHAHHHEQSFKLAEKEMISSSEKCLICIFLLHQQHKEYLISAYHSFVVPAPTQVTHLTGAFAGVYKFTLQGFTNKGPPSSLVTS